MQDAGMRRRLRTLRYPAIPSDDVIEDFNTVRIHDPGFQTALLARLVKAASRCKTGTPPEAPPAVMASTAARIAEDVGEIGRFARRVVRRGEVLTVAEVWRAWCEHNDENPERDQDSGRVMLSLSWSQNVVPLANFRSPNLFICREIEGNLVILG